MTTLFKHTLKAATAMTLAGAAGFAAAEPAPFADWTFSEAATTTLNLTANSGSGLGGAGGTWDVAIPGVAATGTGTLNVRNTGGGGSGTRTTYADFGPVFAPSPAQVSSGTVTLYSTFSNWNLSGTAGAQFSLALIEGNDFTTAQFNLVATPAGVALSGTVDPFGNGANVAATGNFAVLSSQPLTVRLSVDLDADSYSLAWSTGGSFVVLGSAAIDSFTAGVNSLRLSLAGDFTGGGQAGLGLAVDRIWVTQGPVAPVPEPAQSTLWLLGVALAVGLQRRARPSR
jgi:hypothetical protein